LLSTFILFVGEEHQQRRGVFLPGRQQWFVPGLPLKAKPATTNCKIVYS
jgi:hypothetical protein